MKTQTIKTTTKIFSLTALLIVTIAFKSSAQTNYTGTYKINEGKSDFAEIPHTAIPVKYTVNQTKDNLTIQRTNTDDSGKETVATETLKFDGSEIESSTEAGKKKASLRWSTDQKSFVITSKLLSADNNVVATLTDNWTLADGGKALIVSRTVTPASGTEYTIKGYFDKQ